MKVLVNTRILLSRVTGVQRYLREIIGHDASVELSQISSDPIVGGIKGHLWEQLVLPFKVRGGLLWSPSNSGPLLVRSQVVTIHDLVHVDHPEWVGRSYGAWYRFLIPRLILRARRVIAVSEFTKQRLLAISKISPDKISVIHNGVSPRFHPREPSEITDAISCLRLPAMRYILTVGSLEPRKNLERLLAAWHLAQPNIPDEIWLVIAGGRGKSSTFGGSSAVGDLPPRVHVTGHVNDEVLPALFSGAEAFAYVSQYEGFGLPPLEAMASGVPVIVSNTTVFPEVVGDAGLFVDPSSIEDIASGLVRIISDKTLASELTSLGLARAQNFSWKRTAVQTLDLLREVAAEG